MIYQEILKNIWVINSNSLENNCYIVVKNKHCIVIDPATYYDEINEFIKDKKAKLDAIVLTHAHFDHLGCANELCEKYQCKIYAHKDEKLTFDKTEQLALMFGCAAPKYDWKNIILFNSKELKINDFLFKVIHTPGHTLGGIVLVYNNDIYFTGDTLFVESIGRDDGPGGNGKELLKSVKKLALMLKDSDYVLSGHGKNYPQFKVVKQVNPFVMQVLFKR